MLVFRTSESSIALLVAARKENAHGEDVADEEGVQAEVDVEGLGVAGFPDGLEELGRNGVASSPCDDYLLVIHLKELTEQGVDDGFLGGSGDITAEGYVHRGVDGLEALHQVECDEQAATCRRARSDRDEYDRTRNVDYGESDHGIDGLAPLGSDPGGQKVQADLEYRKGDRYEEGREDVEAECRIDEDCILLSVLYYLGLTKVFKPPTTRDWVNIIPTSSQVKGSVNASIA